MKSFLLLGFIFLTSFKYTAPTIVYLCDSNGGKKYHLTATCRGLSNCQHKVIKVTLEKAKKDGKTLCRWED